MKHLKSKCQYKDCKKDATKLAYAKESFDDDKNFPYKINEVDSYCDEHAETVIDKDFPEYSTTCPNCNCYFGVN